MKLHCQTPEPLQCEQSPPQEDLPLFLSLIMLLTIKATISTSAASTTIVPISRSFHRVFIKQISHTFLIHKLVYANLH